MTRGLTLALSLFIGGLLCLDPSAKAWWQSIQQVSVGAAMFAGALNINNTNTRFYAGLDPPTLAFSGNVFRVCDVSTGLVCANATAAAGVVTLPLLGGVACNNVTAVCNIDTLYDTTGSTNCNSFVCDFTQSTNANRPILVVGSPNYFTVNGTSQTLCNNRGYTQAQPFTTSTVINQASSSSNTFFGMSNTGPEMDGNGASGILINAGASVTQASTHGNWYAVQAILNGASSSITIDASPSTGNAGSGGATTQQICLGSYGGNFFWPGKMREIGQWSGAVSGTVNANMIANQKLRGAF